MTKTDFPLYDNIAIAISKLTALTNKRTLIFFLVQNAKNLHFVHALAIYLWAVLQIQQQTDKNKENYNEGIIGWSTTI